MGRTVTAAVLDKSTDSFAFQQIVGQVAERLGNGECQGPTKLQGPLVATRGILEGAFLGVLSGEAKGKPGVTTLNPAQPAEFLAACALHGDSRRCTDEIFDLQPPRIQQKNAKQVGCSTTPPPETIMET